jgi:glycosyltransferase involved in cell wall biosynthesis
MRLSLAMNKPLVSIITPTFNRPEYLREAIKSAQAQTFRDFEHIVVDDHSTDEKAAGSVAAEFHNPDIRFFRNAVNKGMSGTYNAGIREARGEYLAFLEDDDMWLPNYLENQLAMFKADPSLDAVYCHRIFVDFENNFMRNEVGDAPENIFEGVLKTPQIIPSALIVKRSVVESIGGFDERISKGTDWDFTVSVAQVAKVAMNPELLLRYRSHPGQLSNEFFGQRMTAIKLYLFMYEKFKDAYHARPSIETDFLRNLGTNYCLTGDMATGRKYFLAALKVDPRRLKNYRSVLLSFLPNSVYLKLHAMKNHAIYS